MTPFTEADIRAGATMQVFDRGASYYHNGYVSGIVQRGALLMAQVEGSEDTPYQIVVTLTADGGISQATCTCLYDWGGYCKHIVALLLATLRGGPITVKPDLATLLTGLNEAQLRRILGGLVEGDPALIAVIEQEVEWLTATPVTPAQAPVDHGIPVDLAAIRWEIRKGLRNASASRDYGDSYWDDDEAGQIDAAEILGPHQDLAERLLAAGDGAAATEVIIAMIEAWGNGIADLDEWVIENNPDVLIESATDLGALLAEALLSQALTPDQRGQWLARVEDWANDDVVNLDLVETALEQWWDAPALVAAMQGEITEKGAWEGAPPIYAEELTLARLRILARQGRTQEYIHLAEAEGQTSLYIHMLARDGQVERAVAEAVAYLQSPTELLSLARTLAAQDAQPAALMVAAHGLGVTAQVSKTELARWTVDEAQTAGDRDLALGAAQIAFTSSLELADYQAAERLAGAGWPAIKARLLAHLAPAYSSRKVDVYLYEKMLKEAMAAVDGSLYYDHYLERVIEATRAEYPDWGIGKCKQLAESIMNEGKAKYYDTAVERLRTARDIYVQHNRQAEWLTYLNGLIALHGRKYKLVPMLARLRK
ncbi:MAG: SWIM zinc finger domain-containing protein [Caldilineales bacterium]|nr:SWIM zinc finger domain-containing protein [Caldilineales bacterium]